jgi:hypothetical protein
MRFMMIVKASPESEAGVLPTEEQLAEMVDLPRFCGQGNTDRFGIR